LGGDAVRQKMKPVIAPANLGASRGRAPEMKEAANEAAITPAARRSRLVRMVRVSGSGMTGMTRQQPVFITLGHASRVSKEA